MPWKALSQNWHYQSYKHGVIDGVNRQTVSLVSEGEKLSANLVLANSDKPTPALIIAHGAGEFKENYDQLTDYLAGRGISSLVLDMRGHGASEGKRFHVDIDKWIADISAAASFLSRQDRIDAERIAGFGISSGGTAMLEGALVEPRLKALIALDATVCNSLPMGQTILFKILVALSKVKKAITGDDWRIPVLKLSGGPDALHFASDPEVNERLKTNPRALEFLSSFPLPGAASAFFVDTIRRVGSIRVPTLVIWGEEDKLDPPKSGKDLFAALTCEKELHIIAGNGHAGHLDRNRHKVFELTANWILRTLGTANQTLVSAIDVCGHC